MPPLSLADAPPVHDHYDPGFAPGELPAPVPFALADLAAWHGVDPQPKEFIMPGYVPRRELTLVTGAGGANKSTFGQQLATCVAAGVPMLGVGVAQARALYVTAEDDEDRLHWMQTHICKALDVDMATLVGKLNLASLRGRLANELATFDFEGRLRVAAAYHSLRLTIERTGAELIVLDNSAHLFGGNESDRQQVTGFINLLYSLCRDLGCTIILVAHTNKQGDSWSGSTAWLNAVRSQVLIERPKDAADPDTRVLTLGKANYARQGDELPFRWHNFALILETDLPTDQRTEIAANAAASAANEAFLACLRARNDQGDGRAVGPSPGPNYAPAQFEGMPQAKHYRRDDLKRAMDRLFEIGKIQSVTTRNTAKGRDVTVIVEAQNSTPNAHPERFPNTDPERSRTNGNASPRTHSPLKGGRGAAQEAAAPSDDDIIWDADHGGQRDA